MHKHPSGAAHRAADYKIRAERRLGEIQAKVPKARARKGRKGFQRRSSETTDIPTLAEMGVSKDVSSRAQKLAAVPEDVFEAEIAEAKDDANELEFTTFADRMTRWRLVCEVMRLHI